MRKIACTLSVIATVVLAAQTHAGEVKITKVTVKEVEGFVCKVAYEGTMALKNIDGTIEQFGGLRLYLKAPGGGTVRVMISELTAPTLTSAGRFKAYGYTVEFEGPPDWTA